MSENEGNLTPVTGLFEEWAGLFLSLSDVYRDHDGADGTAREYLDTEANCILDGMTVLEQLMASASDVPSLMSVFCKLSAAHALAERDAGDEVTDPRWTLITSAIEELRHLTSALARAS